MRKSMSNVLIVTSTMLSLAAPAFASGDGSKVEVWTRKPGIYASVPNPDKGDLTTADLTSVASKPRLIMDAQYEKKIKIKGTTLAALLAKRSRPAGADMILLHFKNGMIIPISGSAAEKCVTIAHSIESDGKWTSSFPAVTRPDKSEREIKSILFTGNKAIYTCAKYLAPPSRTAPKISPWLHTDSLVGIEFAVMDAYYAQFDAGKTMAPMHGKDVFLARCQFCHGIRQVGARSGWDFVEPLPAYERRPAPVLENHVKYPKAYAAEMGLRMPHQRDVTEAEIKDLWSWLEAVVKNKTKPYKP